MPYSLRGNAVVKSDTGEVVKEHESREKALAHLRALKANVDEARLCECGAPARGLVCQRGHRIEEAWSDAARQAAAEARAAGRRAEDRLDASIASTPGMAARIDDWNERDDYLSGLSHAQLAQVAASHPDKVMRDHAQAQIDHPNPFARRPG